MWRNGNAISARNVLKKKISILLIDDHRLIRESLSQILNHHEAYKVVAMSCSAEEGIRDARIYRPDIIITDITMPGMNGMDALAPLKEVSPASKIIAMSMHSQVAYVRRMFRYGACGYVTKQSAIEELFNALTDVFAGRKYICTEIKNKLSELLDSENKDVYGLQSLSERELQIVRLIKEGKSSREIGEGLQITAKTVEVHRYNILKKLNLSNAAALVNYVNKNL